MVCWLLDSDMSTLANLRKYKLDCPSMDKHKGGSVNISDAFESYGLSNSFDLSSTNDLYNTSAGAFAVGKISDEERFDVVRHACPGAGACGGMFTANTMSSALEVSCANAA